MSRTPGEWKRNRLASTNIEGEGERGVCSAGGYSDNVSNGAYIEENEANAKTIAIAGTAANKIDGLGFDGDKAIETLPELIEFTNYLRFEKKETSHRAYGEALLRFMQAISMKKDD